MAPQTRRFFEKQCIFLKEVIFCLCILNLGSPPNWDHWFKWHWFRTMPAFPQAVCFHGPFPANVPHRFHINQFCIFLSSSQHCCCCTVSTYNFTGNANIFKTQETLQKCPKPVKYLSVKEIHYPHQTILCPETYRIFHPKAPKGDTTPILPNPAAFRKEPCTKSARKSWEVESCPHDKQVLSPGNLASTVKREVKRLHTGSKDFPHKWSPRTSDMLGLLTSFPHFMFIHLLHGVLNFIFEAYDTNGSPMTFVMVKHRCFHNFFKHSSLQWKDLCI